MKVSTRINWYIGLLVAIAIYSLTVPLWASDAPVISEPATTFILWMAGQTVIILIAIVTSAIRSRERLAKLETSVLHFQKTTDGHGSEIRGLSKQVMGISRHVAEIEGRNQAQA